jgi:hypothetical protein
MKKIAVSGKRTVTTSPRPLQNPALAAELFWLAAVADADEALAACDVAVTLEAGAEVSGCEVPGAVEAGPGPGAVGDVVGAGPVVVGAGPVVEGAGDALGTDDVVDPTEEGVCPMDDAGLGVDAGTDAEPEPEPVVDGTSVLSASTTTVWVGRPASSVVT